MSHSIGATEVHLWFAFYSSIHDPAILRRYRACLSDDERRQELRFHFANDRLRYLVTRALVRTVLSRYADVEPGSWTFSRNAYGKPSISIRHGDAACIEFNVSHTR